MQIHWAWKLFCSNTAAHSHWKLHCSTTIWSIDHWAALAEKKGIKCPAQGNLRTGHKLNASVGLSLWCPDLLPPSDLKLSLGQFYFTNLRGVSFKHVLCNQLYVGTFTRSKPFTLKWAKNMTCGSNWHRYHLSDQHRLHEIKLLWQSSTWRRYNWNYVQLL